MKMNSVEKRKPRIGIVGSGFIARGLAYLIYNSSNLHLSGILTRRMERINDLPIADEKLSRHPESLFEKSDLIVVSTGDAVYNTEVIALAFEYGLPVVTMDSETQIVSGSWLCKRGFLTEAEGDQPGSLAALDKEIKHMGFKPILYGNIKGFLNHNPDLAEMQYWANINGISLSQVTSFTDGTKVQIEQCLVANGLGADILQQGLLGPSSANLNEGALSLAKKGEYHRRPISDYILDQTAPAGVFIVASHNSVQLPYLKYLKMGSEGNFVLTKPFHLCHLEIPKTIFQVLNSNQILLNNSSNPRISVGAIAKKLLIPGQTIQKGIGSFDMRGEALNIKDNLNHIPIGLVSNATVNRIIEPGQLITFDDLEIPDSLALKAWKATVEDLIPMSVQL